MPAPAGYRRWDMSMQESLVPDVMYAPTTRYAIVLLGLVIDITILPLGILPSLLGGKTAVASATLQIGDRV